MKLITAIAALALVAGSVDVDAQKRKTLNKKAGGGNKPEAHQMAREGAEEGGPHPDPLGLIAIIAFSDMDEETHRELVESAKEGDEEARQELHETQMNALRAMAEALEDEDQSKLIKAGVMLAGVVMVDDHYMGGRLSGHDQSSGITSKMEANFKLPEFDDLIHAITARVNSSQTIKPGVRPAGDSMDNE